MYRFPCIHAIRRPNISLTFIAVRIRIIAEPSSDHDVNNNIHKTQPRRSTLVRVALVLPPARILREYDPGTYRSRAAVAPRDNFFSARHLLRFLSAPPCTVASRETTGLERVALTAPPAQRKSQRRRPSSTKLLSSRETHNRSAMRRHSREHTCMQEVRLHTR